MKLYVQFIRNFTAGLIMSCVMTLLLATDVSSQILGDPVDVSDHFSRTDQAYFVTGRTVTFDPTTGAGELQWDRYARRPSLSFNKLDLPFVRAGSDEFPGTEYDRDPTLPFSITFVSPRTVRLRVSARFGGMSDTPSLMLVDGAPPADSSWAAQPDSGGVTFSSEFGAIRLERDPWKVTLIDKDGGVLTRTLTLEDTPTFAAPTPFSFVRRSSDLSRSMAASFELAHDERLYGTGESFTRLNKRGQKVQVSLRDAMGAQTQLMYKPIPFFLSSRGYGVFVHTSTPVTFDFGHTFDQSNVIHAGDEMLDLFLFVGSPKEILSEYTALTGRSPVPPLWSFGLWMSRITYESQQEVFDVAERLRKLEIPSDVIHIDTGWFETEWRNNYEFAPSRFPDPGAMISDLKEQGFRVSLWQLPYFTQKNELFETIVDKGFAVANASGTRPFEDAILDFSNPATAAWYSTKLRSLLDLGVGAIKVDFGEDAPLNGLYHSGRTGWFEHNLYPLRYNKIVSDLTAEVTGERIIWARSAWAGSQRYPIHWGGDAEITNSAMAASLRAGLSFGLSGFTYWSHDIGGFTRTAPRELYKRWAAFGALTSHTRVHGTPPREPWTYDDALVDDFRRVIELKYRLLPYIYAQSVEASKSGHPLLRTLFFQFPDDPTSWLIEDQYLLGNDLLVAPMFDDRSTRPVYLPPGNWINYESRVVFEGEKWHQMEAGALPIILLARAGSVIPHAALVQHTGAIDWGLLTLRLFAVDTSKPASGLVALPSGEGGVIEFAPTLDGYGIVRDPLKGVSKWTVEIIGAADDQQP